MDPVTQSAFRAAEQAVRRLLEQCRKEGRLYRRDPRAAAQVNRTARWLLNALANLRRALEAPADSEGAGRSA